MHVQIMIHIDPGLHGNRARIQKTHFHDDGHISEKRPSTIPIERIGKYLGGLRNDKFRIDTSAFHSGTGWILAAKEMEESHARKRVALLRQQNSQPY